MINRMPTFKNKLKFFLRNFGLDINRYNLIESNDFRLNHFLKINDIDCVLDVGANIGQYANNLRRIGYKKKIISFEPLSSAYEVIKKKSISTFIGNNDKILKKWNIYEKLCDIINLKVTYIIDKIFKSLMFNY